MIIEVIVQNHIDAVQAEKLGADRLELVSAIEEGGLTPSHAVTKSVIEAVDIPVQVMVRPHGYSHVYSKEELAVILDDIKHFHEIGVRGIVVGALNEDLTINTDFVQAIEDLRLEGLDVTFHRAFDEVKNVETAYRSLLPFKDTVKRILTSGGKPSAGEGKESLKGLVALSKELNGPEILPGAGVHTDNIADLHETIQANQYHFGKGVRIDDSFVKGFDERKMNKLEEVLKK